MPSGDWEILSELARAKVNLTLRILGKRPDGYHELESLVVFADVGDTLSLTPGEGMRLETGGPFAGALAEALHSENLVLSACGEFLKAWPKARAGRFHLTKKLPVASGIGGGSADAAAALRLLMCANPEIAAGEKISGIARKLGADVAVCLESRAAFMGGIGDKVTLIDELPKMAIVLVNPGQVLATRDVFFALHAAEMTEEIADKINDVPRMFSALDEVAGFIHAAGNDLLPAAASLVPVIGDVQEALISMDGCMAASLSGSGATCFGLFRDERQAAIAAEILSENYPAWWVRAASVR